MKYYLNEIKLNEDNNFSARVQIEKSYDLTGIINLILDRRNVMSRTDLVAAFNIFFETVQGCIKRGENINLPLFNLGYSISGVFNDEEDSFDPARHHVNVNINDGVLINDAVKEIKLTKVEPVDTEPVIKYYKDTASDKVNLSITPGSIFELTGSRLKIGGDDSLTGLYFLADDGTEIKTSLIAFNSYKKLIAQAPQLKKGEYRIRLRTQSSGSSYLTKEPKVATSTFTLAVS